MPFSLMSSQFKRGEPIPVAYTADGEDKTPPLQWQDEPAKTESFALICDDPDAPYKVWVHWVLYNIPKQCHELEEGFLKDLKVRERMLQGENDFGGIGYGGPSPPQGKPHRYFFKLYALDTTLKLSSGVTKKELEEAMQGHILGKAELIGIYQRK